MYLAVGESQVVVSSKVTDVDFLPLRDGISKAIAISLIVYKCVMRMTLLGLPYLEGNLMQE